MSAFGRLFYNVWFKPYGLLRNSIRHGGPWAQARVRKGQEAMTQAARMIPKTPPTNDASALRVHLLTGERFAYQTAFCLHTLGRHAPSGLAPEIYDDGSLSSSALDLLRNVAPNLVLHPGEALRARLDEYLPRQNFPYLRDRWQNYPHIRKLIDVHAGRTGWRLVLDSDLLFWRVPQLLLDWSSAPAGPLHATDCVENYGYPRASLEALAGCPIPPKINVGLIGLPSDDIDWAFLEHATGSLIRNHGTSYYLEQALCALLVARAGTTVTAAPFADYLTAPDRTEVDHPTAAMHHYVDLTRDDYLTRAWRNVMTNSGASQQRQ